MIKMKRSFVRKPPIDTYYTCKGCGNEYNSSIGDPNADIAPGTSFEKLPEDWVCPYCGDEKNSYFALESD